MFRGASYSESKYIFFLLKAFNLCERKSVVKKVTMVKTRVDGKVAIVAVMVKSRVWRMRR